jgi:hypothetical protein
MGDCSSHNAGAVVFGSRFDYDGWAAAGNPGWSARELGPLFASAWKQLRVRCVGLDELTPFQRACTGAIVANGIPAVGYSKDTLKWFWFLGAACLTPLSRGSVRLSGPGLDPIPLTV